LRLDPSKYELDNHCHFEIVAGIFDGSNKMTPLKTLISTQAEVQDDGSYFVVDGIVPFVRVRQTLFAGSLNSN
jgi:hypothetical protein